LIVLRSCCTRAVLDVPDARAARAVLAVEPQAAGTKPNGGGIRVDELRSWLSRQKSAKTDFRVKMEQVHN